MFGSVPAAISGRLATCVRSGPTRRRAGVPWIVWHMTQVRAEEDLLPALLAVGRRLGRGCRCASSHVWNSSSGSATTRNRMFACW